MRVETSSGQRRLSNTGLGRWGSASRGGSRVHRSPTLCRGSQAPKFLLSAQTAQPVSTSSWLGAPWLLAVRALQPKGKPRAAPEPVVLQRLHSRNKSELSLQNAGK